MLKHQVKTAEDALAYLLDCNLATVEGMAGKKSRPSGEYKRQISIAQQHLDWAIVFDADISRTRAVEVKNHRGNVAAWAKSQEV